MLLPRLKAKKPEPGAPDPLTRNVLRVQDLFCPDGLEIGFDYLRLGADRFCRVYAVHGLPRRIQVGLLDEIFLAGDVDLSVHVNPAPDRTVVGLLTRKEVQARTQAEMDFRRGKVPDPEREAQMEDYRALRQAVQLGHDRLMFATVLIAVHGRDPEEFRRRCERVESALSRRGIQARVLVLRQAEGLKSALPLAANRITDFERNLTAGAAACLLPATASGGGHASGVVLGRNVYSGALVMLDRFAGEAVVPNQHMFISGETGSGKSVTVRLLALLEAYRGVRTAFVDPESEYVHFARSLGGQAVRLEPGSFSGVNPLDVEPEPDEDGRLRVNLLEKVADARGLVAAVFRYHQGDGLNARESALLEEAVLEEYRAREITHDPESLHLPSGERKPMPTLSDLQRRLSQKPGGERVADGMKPLLAGGSLGMFDGQTTLALADAPFVCFDLKGLGDDLARFVGMYATLAWFWQKFAQKGGKAVRKCVAVDEAWMFLRHPDAALYLETLARRGRKHGCALTVATQRFEEFAASPEGRAVIDSCATVLVLRQESHAVDAAINYFRLSGGCRKILSGEDAWPGRGILRTSGKTLAVQVEPAPFEWEYVKTEVRGR